MPVVWNSENTTKLLLMIIQNHFSGSPDYDRLSREWGSEVSSASLKIQFCKMRREGVKNGRITKNAKSPVKKKAVDVKEEMIDSD
jgi:hypothetical protein